ncbi:MAG TPA: hypothetical protein VF381_04380, partial [Thermoanaerobaculia bacterium]
LVAEAGMGGRSDEVSLLAPDVVAVTPIFGEHIPILGKNVEEITLEKLKILRPGVKVVSAAQGELVRSVMDRFDADIEFEGPDDSLQEANAAVGIAAARRYVGRSVTLKRRIWLAGRLTRVELPSGQEWTVDSTVNLEGVQAAFDFAHRSGGDVDFVVVSAPDDKDVPRTRDWLNALQGYERWVPVIPPNAEHLPYSATLWQRPLMTWSQALPLLDSKRRVLAIGSWSFMSAVLDYLEIDCARAF